MCRKTLKLICPNLYLDSVPEVNENELKAEGINGFIIDMDNTLISYYSRTADERTLEWMQRVQEKGFKMCIVSNNFASQGEELARQLNIPAVWSAVKPRRRSFRKALQKMKLPPEEVAVVGDQIFTDILGGNRLGMFTVLVVPLSKKEMFWTKLIRAAERWFLQMFMNKGMLEKKKPNGSNGSPEL